jgi:transcriptional regulator with XRE-family HTH domain
VGIAENLRNLRVSRRLEVSDVVRETGLKKQSIYDWEKGKYEPGQESLDVLVKFYGVSEQEILYGNLTSEGKEVRETGHPPARNGRHPIPFFDTIAVGGTEVLADQSAVQGPSDMIYPGSLLATATGALRIYGHSMFPKYPAGCVVAYRDADKDVIIWGEDYVIELSDRRIIKRLEKSAKADCVSAVSYNKSEDYVYAAIDIPLQKIKRLYMVVGKVELEASV